MTMLHKLNFFNCGVPDVLCRTFARIIFMLGISGVNSYYLKMGKFLCGN